MTEPVRDRQDLVVVGEWDEAWRKEGAEHHPVREPDDFFAQTIARAAARVTPHRVLEIGAGGGNCLAWLRQLLPGSLVVGLDYSAVGLRLAAARMAAAGAPRLVASRFEQPPFPPESFDLVCSFGLIEHFTGAQRLACVAAHRALLAPGGLMLLTAPNRRSPAYRAWYGTARVLDRVSKRLAERLSVNVVHEVPLTPKELVDLAVESGLTAPEVLASNPLMDVWHMSIRRVTGRPAPAGWRRRAAAPAAGLAGLGATLALMAAAPGPVPARAMSRHTGQPDLKEHGR